MRSKTSPRTYNQVEVPRPYTPGRRRFSIYWTWSYPWEANRDVTEMDNRFSTITEVRRVAWPAYETRSIRAVIPAGHHRHARTVPFVAASFPAAGRRADGTSSRRVPARRPGGQKLPIDAGILDDTDTLMVFGLDHLVTEQEASPEEIDAMREWLKREGTCLILGPHHDVGVSAASRSASWRYSAPPGPTRAASAAVRPVHAVAR